jgi:hypothetical protein
MTEHFTIYLDTLDNRWELLPRQVGATAQTFASLADAVDAVPEGALVDLCSSAPLGGHGIEGLRRVLAMRKMWDLAVPADLPTAEALALAETIHRPLHDGPLGLQSQPGGRCPDIPADKWLEAAAREGVRFIRLPTHSGTVNWCVEGAYP